jgi:beta-phosphoglucomutase-like phosphatase (HAD superfamily)
MTDNPALDAAIRQARHLLFSFDGPIRTRDSGEHVDPNAPTAPHIYEALVACYESGRPVVVINTKSQIDIDVSAYLNAHDLFTLITLMAASVNDAIKSLELNPADCLFITSSPVDIKAARRARVPSIGMTDLALSLRAHHVAREW